ncbi:MAG: sulfite exporter TauE/SafE family protein [Gammaproteobacteria bacterium]|nr:sulfite exporter TauE/SafE family protein [Gammaproteobacteria bacterium]
MSVDPILLIALYLALGALAGLLAGLLGIGGGLIIVPALAAIFHWQGVDARIIMHLALGTSLATIVVTSISSILAHHKRGAVLWPTFMRLTPGILAGAWMGGWLAAQASTDWLKPLFGVFELSVALYMLANIRIGDHHQLAGAMATTSAGGFIGLISSLVGIGGGTLTVPYLLWHRIEIKQAVATSAACGLPIAVAGSLSYTVFGWSSPQLPDYSLGFIHLPSLLGIIISSSLFAPLGARLAHSLPTQMLKKIFALSLLLVAIKLLTSEF